MNVTPFKEKIYITKSLIPSIEEYTTHLSDIFSNRVFTNNGPKHREFEGKVKDYLRMDNLSLFNNGTISLIIACEALRLQGEVITTPFTFAATPHVLSWNGIKPVFCDIDEDTYNIDVKKIESLITQKTSAILAVHVFGVPCDVYPLQELADKYGLRVIYDAAHAFGVELDKCGIGDYGDISMFSFHATKLFYTAEGGALTYNDFNLKRRIEYLKNFGIESEDEVIMPGINGKMNELQASLGLVLLDYVDAEIEKRKAISNRYNSILKDVEGIKLPTIESSYNYVLNRYNYQYYPIRVVKEEFGKSRDDVHKKLKEYNVFARKYFYPLCSNYSCYSQLPSSDKWNLPVANKVVNEVMCLPLYGDLSFEEVEKICDIIKFIKGE